MEFYFFDDDDLLDDSGDLDYFLDYSGNWHDLFYYFLDLDDPRHLYYLFNNFLNNLGLNLDDFSLHDNRHRFLNVDGFHNFLFAVDDFDLLNFYLLNSLADERFVDLCDDGQFFSNVQRHQFLYLYVFGDHNFLDDGFIDKDLNFSYRFFSISFDEMGAIDVNFFRYFLDQLFLNLQLNINWGFNSICGHDRFISVLADFYVLEFWDFDLDGDFYANFDGLLFFDDVGDFLLDLNHLGFSDYLGYPDLNFPDNFFELRHRY